MSTRDRGVLAPFRSLLGAQALGTVLGLLFWVLVARAVAAPEVGVAAAAITTQTLLGLLVSLGLGTHLVAELPAHPVARQHQLLRRSLLAVAVVGAGAGLLLVLAAGPLGLLGESLAAAVAGPLDATSMVLGVVGAGWALVVDEATLGLRRSSLQVWRNLCASGLRFPLVAGLLLLGPGGPADSTVLQLAWVAPLLLSVALLVLVVHRGTEPGEQVSATGPTLAEDVRRAARPALDHQGLNLAVAAATQVVPVVAAVALAPVDNAAFTIAWRVATVAFLPPYLVAVALYAHGASLDADTFRGTMGRTLPAALVLSLGLCVGAVALGRPGLLVFGQQYAEASYLLLCLLVPAGTWMVVKDHLVAWWRAQREFRLATRVAAASVLLEVGAAGLGATVGGARGLALGWLGGMALSALLGWRWWSRPLVGLPWSLTLRDRTHAGSHPPGPAPDPTLGPTTSSPRTTPMPTPTSTLDRRADHRADRRDDRRDDRGALRPVAAGLLAVVGVAVLGTALVAGLGSLGTAPGDRGDDDAASTVAAEVAECDVERRRDLLVDLGVQVATGDPAQPLRSTREVRRLVARAADAGASVVSTDVGWPDVQPSRGTPPRWDGLDRLLQAAAARDLRIRVQLTGMPSWALDDPAASPEAARWQPPRSPAELRRWQGFVRSALQHLDGRADFVEIWNEPDNPTYWTTGVDPAAFARLLEATAPVARRWAPDARLVTGGLADNDIGYLEALYAALAPGERPFDLVGVHPFAGSRPPASQDPEARYESELGTVDLTYTGYRDLHDVMTANGDGDLGLYLGEFGYSTAAQDGYDAVPDDLRARYLPQALDLAACDRFVAGIGWYYLHPTRWDDPAWTLLDERLRPSLTYDALVAWTQGRV
ncbi:hypothetical protein [Nocardioides sp.]|uniref:hypothetical protein n=1 Tax=Nocardioides sp. TaxID=35761 RepID=UPI00261FB8E4|nr:hypothetical protein [Nocardioides sp.]